MVFQLSAFAYRLELFTFPTHMRHLFPLVPGSLGAPLVEPVGCFGCIRRFLPKCHISWCCCDSYPCPGWSTQPNSTLFWVHCCKTFEDLKNKA